jgi:hypothetical protein
VIKLLPLFLLILVVVQPPGCRDRKRPDPPRPSPTPTAEPSPSIEPTPVVTPEPSPTVAPSPQPAPTTWATPHPTPNIDPAAYIPAVRSGSTVRLRGEEGEDYAAKIQAVMDNSTDIGTVVLGPGSLKRSVILRTHTRIETTPQAPLACDQVEDLPQYRFFPRSDYGCMLIIDGVHVSGNFRPPQELLDYFAKGDMHLGWKDPYFQKLAALTDDQIHGNYSTVLEPEFSLGPGNPGIMVFEPLKDMEGQPRRGVAHNIAVTGIVIQGRQKTHYDGGIRQAMTFGNCQRCTAQSNFLRDTGSIGIQAGGASDEGGFSNDVVFTLNINSGGAAAHLASVNGDNIYGFHNYSRRPGRKGWGGGISAFDMETNGHTDHSNNVWIYNNVADYEGASLAGGAGNAFLAQDPFMGSNRGTVHIVNNVAIGGREDNVFRFMSNGIYTVGMKGCRIVNNYVFRTGQNAVQMYSSDGCLVQDQDFEHTGGGGAFTVQFYGVRNTTVRRAHFRTTPGLPLSAAAGISEIDGSCGNIYEDNRIDGRPFELTSPPCRAMAARRPRFVSGSSWRGLTGVPLRNP